MQTTPKVIKKAPIAPNVTVSVASAEKRDIDKYNLPPDILSDLQEAFEFYDSERKSYISIQQCKNILHNFGFAKK